MEKMKIALYPGSFDPLTKGHVDMIERAAKIFDKVYVAVAVNISKNNLFSPAEKLVLAKQSTDHIDNAEIIPLETGLSVELAKKLGCSVLIRGLRNTNDFEYETNVALMNKLQNSDIETVFLLSDERYRFVSSSIIKEVAYFGGDVSALVPKVVNDAIQAKYAEQQ